jgi:hypothetical protein
MFGPPFSPSEARGVDQDAAGSLSASSIVRREKSLFPAMLLPFCAGVPAIGVGQCALSVASECLPVGSLYFEEMPRFEFGPRIASPA